MNNKLNSLIDIKYDVRKDSNDLDPDKHSNTLKSYHKKLWSKLLPNGKYFDLNDNNPSAYLYHKSDLGEYFLSSDSIIHTYSKWLRTKNIIEEIKKEEITAFLELACTVGGYIIFPCNKVNNLPTINQERGCNKKICDRFDLTSECIRSFYSNEKSPLKETLDRYYDYFQLFKNFKGYCEYFLLQDLASNDYSEINFFLPFNGFESTPLPNSVAEYYEYRKNNMKFVTKRNKRMEEYDRLLNIKP